MEKLDEGSLGDLPSEVAADLQGLIDDLKRDRLPGFVHEPAPEPAQELVLETVPASAQQLSAFSSLSAQDHGGRSGTRARPDEQPGARQMLAPEWVDRSPAGDPSDPYSTSAGDWLRVNWPFVLSVLFVLLGLVLIILLAASR